MPATTKSTWCSPPSPPPRHPRYHPHCPWAHHARWRHLRRDQPDAHRLCHHHTTLAITLAAQGPTTRTGATLCCLTHAAGGELTGNPQVDWLLRAGTTGTEYPQLSNGPYTSPQRNPPPRKISPDLTTASLVWRASPCESADLSQGAMTQRINRRALAHALPRGEGPGDTPRLLEDPDSPARACARALGAATVTLRETTGP